MGWAWGCAASPALSQPVPPYRLSFAESLSKRSYIITDNGGTMPSSHLPPLQRTATHHASRKMEAVFLRVVQVNPHKAFPKGDIKSLVSFLENALSSRLVWLRSGSASATASSKARCTAQSNRAAEGKKIRPIRLDDTIFTIKMPRSTPMLMLIGDFAFVGFASLARPPVVFPNRKTTSRPCRLVECTSIVAQFRGRLL